MAQSIAIYFNEYFKIKPKLLLKQAE